MKYSELAKLRAKQLYEQGVISYENYTGRGNNNYNADVFNPDLHICWAGVCIDERNDLWHCEVCGKPLGE